MNANVSKLLNEQINKEFYSAYLYLDFANYYASVGLDCFENWYKVQAQEERDHAMLFYQYLQNNGEGPFFRLSCHSILAGRMKSLFRGQRKRFRSSGRQ